MRKSVFWVGMEISSAEDAVEEECLPVEAADDSCRLEFTEIAPLVAAVVKNELDGVCWFVCVSFVCHSRSSFSVFCNLLCFCRYCMIIFAKFYYYTEHSNLSKEHICQLWDSRSISLNEQIVCIVGCKFNRKLLQCDCCFALGWWVQCHVLCQKWCCACWSP